MISQNYPKNSQNPRKIDPQKNDLYFSHRNQMRSLKNNMGKRHQKNISILGSSDPGCISDLYFRSVFLICISRMYFGSVFLGCISELYFLDVSRICISRMCSDGKFLGSKYCTCLVCTISRMCIFSDVYLQYFSDVLLSVISRMEISRKLTFTVKKSTLRQKVNPSEP